MIQPPAPSRPLLRALCLLACTALLACGWGCAPPQPRSAYPPADAVEIADDLRQGFVNAFLQGRWCEAVSLFEESVQGFVMRDDMCEAGATYHLAWKLKKYIGINDASLLQEARRYRRLGFGCPGRQALPGHEDDMEHAPSERDAALLTMLGQGQLDALLSAVRQEPDPLYASVYARKGARAALELGDEPLARQFLDEARRRDAAKGWVVCLREDWRLQLRLADEDEARTIRRRIALLDQLIEPCTLR